MRDTASVHAEYAVVMLVGVVLLANVLKATAPAFQKDKPTTECALAKESVDVANANARHITLENFAKSVQLVKIGELYHLQDRIEYLRTTYLCNQKIFGKTSNQSSIICKYMHSVLV